MKGKDLTKRELEVLKLASEKGLSNIQIANELIVAENTIKNHMSRIYRKLDVGSDRQAISHYWQRIYMNRSCS